MPIYTTSWSHVNQIKALQSETQQEISHSTAPSARPHSSFNQWLIVSGGHGHPDITPVPPPSAHPPLGTIHFNQ